MIICDSSGNPLLEGVKAVLFDMDGVLYNSMSNHAVAWQQAMAQFGICMTATDAYATEGARGIDTIRQMVHEQQQRDISLEEAQRMYDVKTRLFHDMPAPVVFEGVHDLMHAIRQHGGQVSVVTGSGQRPLIQRLLNDFGEYLDEQHIVTAYDVNRGKPNPDPYQEGLRRCNIENPQQAVVIENAPLGIQAGVAAGCFTIAVNTGPLADEQLIQAGAHYLIHHLYELHCT